MLSFQHFPGFLLSGRLVGRRPVGCLHGRLTFVGSGDEVIGDADNLTLARNKVVCGGDKVVRVGDKVIRAGGEVVRAGGEGTYTEDEVILAANNLTLFASKDGQEGAGPAPARQAYARVAHGPDAGGRQAAEGGSTVTGERRLGLPVGGAPH